MNPKLKKPLLYGRLILMIIAMVWCIESGYWWAFILGLMAYSAYWKRETYAAVIKTYKDAIVNQWNMPNLRKQMEENKTPPPKEEGADLGILELIKYYEYNSKNKKNKVR